MFRTLKKRIESHRKIFKKKSESKKWWRTSRPLLWWKKKRCWRFSMVQMQTL